MAKKTKKFYDRLLFKDDAEYMIFLIWAVVVISLIVNFK
jgi:hypothetical protein